MADKASGDFQTKKSQFSNNEKKTNTETNTKNFSFQYSCKTNSKHKEIRKTRYCFQIQSRFGGRWYIWIEVNLYSLELWHET
jgi:hypothetical protein